MNDPSSPASTSAASSTEAEIAEPEPSSRRKNPYVGPRPFCKGELFFGREREATSVVNSLLSSRVMLLHSPSGAGKTSLIQTSVVPSFERRGFLICAGREVDGDTDPEFMPLRVNFPPPQAVPNRYVFSVVNGIIGNFTDHERIVTMTMADAVEEFARHHDSQQRQLLVFDQLEEALTLNPGDVDGQTAFFEQLGEVLADSRRWALLAIREDYMGALDRFRQYLPGQLRATFRLDLLDVKAALRAVQKPAMESGVEFSDDAAEALVHDLRLVYSGRGDEDAPSVGSPYVEPALLQVVCFDLFRKLSKGQGSDFEAITVANVDDSKPFSKAISKYYRSVIREAAEATKEADVGDAAQEAVVRGGAAKNPGIEKMLRDWVGHDLIAQQRLRRQTRQKPSVPKPDAALRVMQGMYLIRDDPRPGGPPLWELSHDMLVGPVLEDNRAWRVKSGGKKRLELWQVLAEDWHASGRDPELLLQGSEYLAAAPHRRRAGLTKTEHAYLEASAEVYRAEGRKARLKRQLGQTRILLALSVLVNVVLVILLWHHL